MVGDFDFFIFNKKFPYAPTVLLDLPEEINHAIYAIKNHIILLLKYFCIADH